MTKTTTPRGFEFDPTSPVSELRSGDAVMIGTTKHVVDWPYQGRSGTLLGFSRPHGFAIVSLDGAEHLFHPESLVTP